MFASMLWIPPFSPMATTEERYHPASDRRFKQGTPDRRPMRMMHRGTSSESIDELAEGKRSRASSGQLPPANQRAGSNRVGAPKHATPTDDLTCKSFLKPTCYRRPPSSIAPIFVAMPAICSYYHPPYHGCCAVFSRLCHHVVFVAGSIEPVFCRA